MELVEQLSPGMERVPSGIHGLDKILQGGFLKGGIYIVMGTPGAGKTILGNQICYNLVAAGGRALYVTLLAETHDRMIAHLQAMSFFTASVIAKSLFYISGYSAFEQDGLGGLLTLLRKELIAQQATVLILDGMTTLEASAEADLSFKRFVHELQAYAQTIGCTTFLLTPTPSEVSGHHGHTMVDGILELRREHVGPRIIREVEIHKFRGSTFLEGRHRFIISADGITAYPRIETIYGLSGPATAPAEDQERRAELGIPGLDEMLYGGVLKDSTTMLLGAPGSGKTILGLHFLHAGARRGEPGLYVGFYEQPASLLRKAHQIGLDFKTYVDRGLINIDWHTPLEAIPDAVAEHLLHIVRERRIARLFFDGLDGLADVEAYPQRLSSFITALTGELRALGVTTVCAAELGDLFRPTISPPLSGASAVVDNIIFLRYIELRSQLYRLVSILKARQSDYDSMIREFRLTGDSVSVAAASKAPRRFFRV